MRVLCGGSFVVCLFFPRYTNVELLVRPREAVIGPMACGGGASRVDMAGKNTRDSFAACDVCGPFVCVCVCTPFELVLKPSGCVEIRLQTCC